MPCHDMHHTTLYPNMKKQRPPRIGLYDINWLRKRNIRIFMYYAQSYETKLNNHYKESNIEYLLEDIKRFINP